jgi:hypothetical protein
MSYPLPPVLPDSESAFAAHVTAHVHEWYEYCRQIYEYVDTAQESLTETHQAALRIQALELEIEEHKRRSDQLQAQSQAVREYQKEEIKELTNSLAAAIAERNKAIELSAPIVRLTPPDTTIQPLAKGNAADATRTPPSTSDTSSTPARLSEKQPDPDKFTGDRKDLRRFLSQIHEKMTVNRDRFPNSQSRMSYVNSRLNGNPYAQVLPYIVRGICQLPDYEAILELLERAYGDPNRVRNSRTELFRLRQNNKEFSVFFAEFQRLALEGELSEEALPTLLEEAVNRELKGMLLHHEPPSREYHAFAKFLQDLDNRRKQYETFTTVTPKTYANATRTRQETPVPVRTQTTRPQSPPRIPGAVRIAEVSGDPMDLSRGRSTRHERKECYRCGSEKHFVRDCPQPNNRPVRSRPVYEDASSRSPSPPSTEYRTRMLLRPASPLSSSSAKGVSLT